MTTAPKDVSAPPDRRRPRTSVTPYLLAAPMFLAVIVALGYPLVRQLLMSFQEFGLRQQFGQPPAWVGLDNYKTVLSDPAMLKVLVRSIAFCLVCMSLTMVIGVGLAALMTAISRWARLMLQVCLLLVWAMPVMVTMTVWQWLFDSRYGVVNWLLSHLGISGMEGHAWTADPMGLFTVAALIVIWMSIPLVAFMSYAGLSQVPAEVMEAASLDGASAWRRFRSVTLPLVLPVIMIVGLLQIVWDLRVFTQIYVLQQSGGSTEDTNLLGTAVYRLGIGQGNYGVASALATVVLLLTLLLTWKYIATLLKQQKEATDR
ncbi:carbohydrate ABC transporter permease [Streptomyces sp. NPDC056061]|uniref:carbohydrate ABC transporter permease n=1 Tax=Streptomyces sp. NPDC056061 TaxID=3345700 RepID=UPI0035D8680B